MPQLANDRYERFCREYVVDHNGTRAATAAGFSPRGARFRASHLMARQEITDRIAELEREQAERLEITADRTMLEVARIAYATMGDYVTWGPAGATLVESSNLTPDQIAAVLEVSESVSGGIKTVSIKLHPKLAALTLLMKKLGLLKEQVDVNHRGAVRFIPPEVATPAPDTERADDRSSEEGGDDD